MPTTLSIAIATYNEEQNIKRCLDSVKSIADEVIIVDGCSVDKTVAIAKGFSHVRIISTDNKPIFHINKQMAVDAATSDWILQLDADEVVSPSLLKDIQKILDHKPEDIVEAGFWLKRKNYFLGKFLTKGGVYPDPTIRLYKKGLGKLPCKDVHEQAEITGPTGWLEHDLLHYADPTFSRYLLRSNRYTTLLAQELKTQKTKINFFNFINFFIFKPTYWFFLAYFRHRGYVDGFPGFVFAWYSSLRFPISYIKYYEIQKSKSELSMINDWD